MPNLLTTIVDAGDGGLMLPGAQIVCGALLLYIIYFIGRFIYNIYFHPFARVPGSKLHAISKIPSILSLIRGTLAQDTLALHEKYGEVIRLSPDQVSFTNPEAWKDIYGYRNGKPHFIKDPVQYIVPINGVHNIHSTPDDVVHARQRRLLSHAFSEKALREQEPLLQSYVDLLVSLLHEQVRSANQGKVDLVRWLNFTTFDIIGDLTFGESFKCLEEREYHPWISIVFEYMRAAIFLVAAGQFPFLNWCIRQFLPKRVMQMQMDHFNLSVQKMDKRLATKTDRPDFVTYLQRENNDKAMSLGEIHSNAPIFILAGSETTATALSGCFYYLCQNPQMMKNLTSEIRTAITSPDQLNSAHILPLKYMQAVLDEGMRVYPPVPGDLPRMAPKGGASVAGLWVPEGMRTTVVGWAMSHYSANYKDPFAFVPERWIDDSGVYAGDRATANQPFSFGPRNCIGKNLAYAEMRLIMAKLLWEFDMELCEESENWPDQRTFVLWDKPPLMVKLMSRIRA